MDGEANSVLGRDAVRKHASIWMDKKEWADFRAKCVLADSSLADVIEGLMALWIQKSEGKKEKV